MLLQTLSIIAGDQKIVLAKRFLLNSLSGNKTRAQKTGRVLVKGNGKRPLLLAWGAGAMNYQAPFVIQLGVEMGIGSHPTPISCSISVHLH